MILFLLSFAVFVLAAFGLAFGVLVRGKPLKGTCGGDAALMICPMCPIDKEGDEQ